VVVVIDGVEPNREVVAGSEAPNNDVVPGVDELPNKPEVVGCVLLPPPNNPTVDVADVVIVPCFLFA
jgi:hypothetical protein